MDQAILNALAQADPVLAKVISTTPAPQIVSTRAIFHDLMSCLIEQQIHYRSTKKTFAKLLAKAGLTQLTPENFPEFAKAALPGVKLAQAKYETMNRVLEFWSAHPAHWPSFSDEQVTQKLASIPGIGQWTIDMLLLYTQESPDIFPSDDYHLKQLMVGLYNLNPQSQLKAQMKAIAARWGNQKSLAVKYLFESKKTKQPL
ncbi:MAG: hypothetical protein MUC97_07355 [Bernardetiaceae bacterium]|nr:hypothetical protein [Bernardetiaceae bacterium]